MDTSLEAWADAMAVDTAFGADAAAYISDQIETHMLDGDAKEAARWYRINLALIALHSSTKH